MSVLRCGSIIVDLALKFNSTTKEQDVIITLNDAVEDGKLGEFSVGAIKGKRPDVEPTGRGATSPLDGSYNMWQMFSTCMFPNILCFLLT